MKPPFTESPNLWLRASRTYTGSDQGYAMYGPHKSPLFTPAEKWMVRLAIVVTVLACLGAFV